MLLMCYNGIAHVVKYDIGYVRLAHIIEYDLGFNIGISLAHS